MTASDDRYLVTIFLYFNFNKQCWPCIVDTFQDFLIAEHMKPHMHLLEIVEVRNWHFLSPDFGVLVGLTTKWFSEEMLISNMCMHGFMCSAIEKS